MAGDPHNKFNEWKQEQVVLEELKAVRPELFETEKRSSSIILTEIGIPKEAQTVSKGYIKFSPFDFIVEEIRKDGTVITIDRAENNTQPSDIGGTTIYADLVKIGISSIEAAEHLAEALSCDRMQISYAGIKDTVAVTAQKISIRGVSDTTVKSLTIPQLFLKNISQGKGIVGIGDLEGNRFTLYIRTTTDFNGDVLDTKMSDIASTGLYNYYGPQRFGSPRYVSHILGKYLLQGNFEKVVTSILFQTSRFEWAFVTQLRTRAQLLNNDWKVIRALFATLPYTFRSELQLLDRILRWNGIGDCWIYALGFAPDQIDLWTKSYASYLANKLLFRAETGDIQLPDTIPLLLNISPTESARINELYGRYLQEDGTTNFRKNIATFPFIRMGTNSYLTTKIFPKIISCKKMPHGLALSFDLIKGAYATTLLYELFDIVEGDDAIEMINQDFIDTKKELGLGSFGSVREWAEQYIDIKNK
jgi:tRNA pseudouridine13 synthase